MARPIDEPRQPVLPNIYEPTTASEAPAPEAITFRKAALLSVDDIYERADDALLRLLKEDKRIERKLIGFLKSHELAVYLSMWANTAPEGGLVAVGVSNNGKMAGCLGTEIEHLNRLEHEACQQCPDARVDSKRIPIVRDKDGQPDFVQLFRVRYNKTRVVFTTRNEVYTRRGESKHKLTHHEIIDLQNDKGEVRVEQELLPEYVFPDDFETKLVNQYIENVIRGEKEQMTVPELLARRHLGEIRDGRFIPNAAFVLAFARDPRNAFAGAKVFLLRYEGEHEGVGSDLNTSKSSFAEGNIPALLREIDEFLTGQLREFSSLGPDNRFYPQPEYPRAVWFEAVLNALVHRSYGTFKGMATYVKMFDNRLEIQSPGGFPPGITPANIYSAISHPRNPFLMEALWFLGYVKNIGEGTRRMLALMKESALPDPEFSQMEVGHSVVRVVLRNNIKQRRILIDSAIAASIISPEVYASLSEDERAVMNHIAEHKTINTSQAMRITQRGWKSAHRLLVRLVRVGILRHHHRKDIDRDPQAYFDIAPPRRLSTSKG